MVNDALLAKWVWRYRVEEENIWRRVVTTCHGRSRKWSSLPSNPALSRVWKNIMSMEFKVLVEGKRIHNHIKGVLGDGSEGEEDIKNWKWTRPPSSPDEVSELGNCSVQLGGIFTASVKDKWMWKPDVSGQFSTKLFTRIALGTLNEEDLYPTKSCGWVPAKCNILIWRAALDRIPTRQALVRRNIAVESYVCALCGEVTETVDHIFTACSISLKVWNRSCVWAKLPPFFAFSFKDILDYHKSVGGDKKTKELVCGLVVVAVWCIWKARNEKIFADGRGDSEEILGSLDHLDFFLVKM
ncbi:uncharacterized protein LOC110927200 [Helianthus annuus]|uniref:uncharacterized protein LOC110927200 n=1 Tax=Helianthus annuus TaxID=4232 RepID=UPI001652F6D6|nr:uncharacterized protein LOC110927200 [Helianthus annuus]